ncbi:unnamed protein product [Didymodactylos carnosus]|uniref:Uncharacterized protein n=1 Tax=Didymodactylos carnosus TaxID=1234261 RepID=A0A8S2RZG3_9BILA|nr:unnamed protein product [Didymodactylos carnosus]CAF4197564.1 unnamed protein product [Didymodactylos carnosus]
MTFNLDFITKDSPIRASLAKYADSANDIILKDTSGNDKNSLSTVQLKYGSETNVKMLGSPKYSQVNQKVAPKGMSGGKWSENIKYDGISSKPFDNEEVQKFLSNTERSFNKFRMDIGSTAVKAALTSGLVNAGGDDQNQCVLEEGLTGGCGTVMAVVGGAVCASLLGPWAAVICSSGAGYITRRQVRAMTQKNTKS